MRVISAIISIIFSYYFAQFFIKYLDFIYYAYQGSAVSKFLPFGLIMLALIFILCLLLVFIFKIFKDIQLGIIFLIVYLPMSALPFIILGVPASVLDQVFICRSNVFFFVWLLFCKVIFDLIISNKSSDIKFPLLINVIILVLVYLFNIFNVKSGFEMGAVESLYTIITSAAIFYLFITYVKDLKLLHKIIVTLVIACFVQIVFSSLSFFYYLVIKEFKNLRVEGLLRSYELFAEYLIIHIPLIFFLMRVTVKKLPKKVFMILLFLLFYVLLATQTRGAFISLFVGMSYYLFMLRKREKFYNTLRISIACIVLTLLAFFILYKTVPAASRIFERFASYQIGTLDTRQYVWDKFAIYFKERPLLGYGMVYNLRTYLFLPHSTYFSYLLTMGILGLVAYVSFLIRIVIIGMRNNKLSIKCPYLYELSVALSSSLLIIIVDSLKIEYLKRSNYQLIVWMYFALIIALNQVILKTSRQNSSVGKE